MKFIFLLFFYLKCITLKNHQQFHYSFGKFLGTFQNTQYSNDFPNNDYQNVSLSDKGVSVQYKWENKFEFSKYFIKGTPKFQTKYKLPLRSDIFEISNISLKINSTNKIINSGRINNKIVIKTYCNQDTLSIGRSYENLQIIFQNSSKQKNNSIKSVYLNNQFNIIYYVENINNFSELINLSRFVHQALKYQIIKPFDYIFEISYQYQIYQGQGIITYQNEFFIDIQEFYFDNFYNFYNNTLSIYNFNRNQISLDYVKISQFNNATQLQDLNISFSLYDTNLPEYSLVGFVSLDYGYINTTLTSPNLNSIIPIDIRSPFYVLKSSFDFSYYNQNDSIPSKVAACIILYLRNDFIFSDMSFSSNKTFPDNQILICPYLSQGILQTGKKIKNVLVENTSYSLYSQINTFPNNDTTWMTFTFIADRKTINDFNQIQIQLNQFFHVLITNNYISEGTIVGIQQGFRIYNNGAGYFKIFDSSFSLSIITYQIDDLTFNDTNIYWVIKFNDSVANINFTSTFLIQIDGVNQNCSITTTDNSTLFYNIYLPNYVKARSNFSINAPWAVNSNCKFYPNYFSIKINKIYYSRPLLDNLTYMQYTSLQFIISIPNIQLIMCFVSPMLNFLDEFSYYIYHRHNYPSNLVHIFQVLQNFTISSYVPFSLQNYFSEIQILDLDDLDRTPNKWTYFGQSVYFLSNVQNFLIFTLPLSILMFTAILLIYRICNLELLKKFSIFANLYCNLIGQNIQYLSFRAFQQFYMLVPVQFLGLINLIVCYLILGILLIYSMVSYILFRRWYSFDQKFYIQNFRLGLKTHFFISTSQIIQFLKGFINAYFYNNFYLQIRLLLFVNILNLILFIIGRSLYCSKLFYTTIIYEKLLIILLHIFFVCQQYIDDDYILMIGDYQVLLFMCILCCNGIRSLVLMLDFKELIQNIRNFRKNNIVDKSKLQKIDKNLKIKKNKQFVRMTKEVYGKDLDTLEQMNFKQPIQQQNIPKNKHRNQRYTLQINNKSVSKLYQISNMCIIFQQNEEIGQSTSHEISQSQIQQINL